ncbi:MAG: DUF4384 domain-containing protein [Gemmataceae bacterium]|nr:DUF4384 domain-containing protein [Gemmataceae bacterium]
MNPNDDLSRWGEPPASDAELELARLLGDAAEGGTPSPALSALLRAGGRVEEMVRTILTHCGASNPPGPADAGGEALELRLVVELMTTAGFVPLGSTNPRFAVRDLKRVEPDRLTVRTGDRVRVVAECGREGWLTVLNVGPTGNVNLLAEARQRAGVPLVAADVQVTPPAGTEKVFAVWSERPLDAASLAAATGRGAVLRDMVRVTDGLRLEEWRAAVLELRHEG